MIRPQQGSPNRPTSLDSQPVSYLVARDRFLTRFPDSEDELIHYYADIGRYVLDRWQAEERDRVEGAPLDELATDCRWDECTEKHLRDLSTEVGVAYRTHVRRARVLSLLADWRAKAGSLATILQGVGWFLMEAWRGFVGAIGILIFGLLLVWIAPNVTKNLRSVVDDTLPKETRPEPLVARCSEIIRTVTSRGRTLPHEAPLIRDCRAVIHEAEGAPVAP